LQHGGAADHRHADAQRQVQRRAAGPAEQTEQELAALWKRADAALYAAKAQGRDRLVFSEPA
jgi:GGDEF domain-containing protein